MQAITRATVLAAATLLSVPSMAGAFADCPADHITDGYTCDEQTGAGKTGGFFRITFPSNWDGDLVIYNHGFDLNDLHIRPHEVCGNGSHISCEQDTDCTLSGSNQWCNNISYSGLDEILLPMGKAIAASTYSTSGWAPFQSAKDIKDILQYVKKESGRYDELKRVIITGFSGGGAVTLDATLKLNIDGAVPLCGAVGGGTPTWDLATDVRMIYDYLCDDVPGAVFTSEPDVGEKNSANSGADSIGVAIKVNACFGSLSPSANPVEAAAQADRLAKFMELSTFEGNTGVELITAIGFATLGVGDFVRDKNRLNNKPFGLNETADYSTLNGGGPEATAFNAGVQRLSAGQGRKKVAKASWPDYTRGKGKNADYPILSMAGSADWLVVPQFQSVFTTARSDGDKPTTQTWISSYGHCVFTPEEMTATFNSYFDWLGPVDGPYGVQPTAQDVEDACLALPTGVDGDTCNFNTGYSPGLLMSRIPARPDWPYAATH